MLRECDAAEELKKLIAFGGDQQPARFRGDGLPDRRPERNVQVNPLIDPGVATIDQDHRIGIRCHDRTRQRNAGPGRSHLRVQIPWPCFGRSPGELPFHCPAPAGRVKAPDLAHGSPGHVGRRAPHHPEAKTPGQRAPARLAGGYR